jgi:hypothetical protein
VTPRRSGVLVVCATTAKDGRDERKATVKRAALISVIVGTAIALVPVASAVEVSDGGGAASHAVSTFTPTSQLDPAIQAVLLRNRFTQSVPFQGRPDILGGTGTTQAASGNSFDVHWSAVIPGIVLGALLIGMTATVVTRRRHQLSV